MTTTELTSDPNIAALMILGGKMNEEGIFTDFAGVTPTTQPAAVPKPSRERMRIVLPPKGEGWRPEVRFIAGSVRAEDGFTVSQFLDPSTECVLESWKPAGNPMESLYYLLVPAKPSPLFESLYNGRYTAVPEAIPATPEHSKVNITNPGGRCLCGCGAEVSSRFKPGHDARLKGQLLGRLRSGAVFAKEEPEAQTHGTGDPAEIARRMGWEFLLEKAGKP